MSSVNKILLWIRICNLLSYAVMLSFVEFESLKKWLVLPLLTCRFLTSAIWSCVLVTKNDEMDIDRFKRSRRHCTREVDIGE